MFRRLNGNFVRGLPILTALALVLPPAGPAVQAADQPLPAAREVVNRFIAAIGGAEAMAKISSMRLRGSLEVAEQNITGTIEILHARPARMVTRVTIPGGIGADEQGYDGKVGWVLGRTPPEVLSGRRLNEMAHDARFDGILRDSRLFKELTTVERTRHDGRPAFKLKAVYVDGLEQFEFFDVETGFLLGTEGSRALPEPFGVVPTVTYLRQYRAFGPIRHPTEVVQRSIGLVQTLRWESFEYDVVPASAFDLPAPIKALVR
jgi:hypothetical protein